MVELAAKKWNTDCRTALNSLSRQGFSMPSMAGITEYHQLREARDRMHAYRRSAAAELSHSPQQIQPQLRKVDLIQGLRPSVWQQRTGQFVGCSDYVSATAVFRPSVDSKMKAKQGKHHIFRGPNWSHVFSIPYFDLPGHFSGWLFAGRKCGQDDLMFWPNCDDASCTYVESGLAMFDVLYKPVFHREQFGKTTFVFEDPLLALRLQASHLRHHGLPLPLVATFTGAIHRRFGEPKPARSRAVWHTRPNRRYTFWHHSFSANTINDAACCDGRVQFCDKFFSKGAWEHRWLVAAKQQAVPWEVALQDRIDQLDDVGLAGLLPQLELEDNKMEQFLHSCTTQTRDRLSRLWDQRMLVRTVQVNGVRVSETPDGWYDDNKATRISDTILRIDKAIYNVPADKTFFQGRIIYQDKELAFVEEESKISHHTHRWLTNKLVQAGISVPLCPSGWRSYLLEMALLFQRPAVFRTSGKFGWDREQARFVLPTFGIGRTGKLLEEETPVIDDLAPAINWPLPTMSHPRVDLLTDDNQINRIFWAMSAAIAANIVAPAKNQPPSGIGMIGEGASIIGRLVAQVWGCCTFAPFKGVRRSANVLCESVEEANQRHHWPLVLTVPASKQKHKLSGWLNSVEDKNAILDVDRSIADALGTQANWRFLIDETRVFSSPTINDHGSLVAVSWLQHFCAQEFRLPDADSLLDSVLQSMAEWVDGHGNPAVVLSARDLLDDATEDANQQAQRFASLLYRFVSSGALSLAHEGYTPGSGKMDMVEFDGSGDIPPGIFVSRRIVNKLLANHNVPLPDPVQITHILANAGALEGEIDYDGYGWLIRKSWWESQLEFFRERQHRLLRVVR